MCVEVQNSSLFGIIRKENMSKFFWHKIEEAHLVKVITLYICNCYTCLDKYNSYVILYRYGTHHRYKWE